jgi:hypothetical protein
LKPRDENGQETAGQGSRRRMRPWTAAIEARGRALAERAEVERGRHGSVDALYEIADRDGEVAFPYAGVWFVIAKDLPHRDADWKALVPGALLFGLGAEVIHVLAQYLIGPYSLAKQGTYGALGLAAVLLLGLFLVSRLVVATAVLNATLWARRTRPERAPGTSAAAPRRPAGA